MAVIESWVLDSVPLTSGAFTLMELTADPPRARMDWITAADSEDAVLFRQPLHENRTITMKLRVTPQASMDAALDQVAALVTKLRLASSSIAGIALVWTPTDSARSRTFDVVAGEITGMPISLSGDGYSWVLHRPIVTVELTCKPYWRGTEVLTSTASSSTPFVDFEIAGVTGDVPALGRLIITDTATQSRRHVEWGLEGPLTYNSATSLLIDSDNMVTSGFAGTQVTTGAYDPNASGADAINCGLFAGAQIAVAGTGNLSHIGTFRVKARVYSVAGTQVRISYQAGDGPLTANPWATYNLSSQWADVDLGTITIPAVVSGTQRWTGRVEALHPTATLAGFYLDYLILVPVSDGYGKARAAYSYAPGVVTGYDAFVGTTAAAALNARVATAGGTWATSGVATDFAFGDTFNFVDTTECVFRATAGAEATARFAILGSTNYTNTEVSVLVFRHATVSGGYEQCVVARYVDASNHLLLITTRDAATRIDQVVAGVTTTLVTSPSVLPNGVAYRLTLIAYASGRVIGQVRSSAGAVVEQLEALSAAVATGGALQTGKPGIRDRATNAGSGASRPYTQFAVSTPSAEPVVLFSGRNMQVRHDDTIRQDSAGTYAGRPPSYRGSRFLVPVGTSRVLVKARRNDVDSVDDSNVTDALQIQIGWTPRGLAVPR